MPSLHEVRDLSVAILRNAPTAIPFIVGPPGAGKSDITHEVAEALDIPPERVLVVHINNHDVVDLTGVPSVDNRQTVFNPTEMFYQFKHGTGPGLIVIEEIAQASPHHQTWFAGFGLERKTPTFELDPQVRIMCTGNRQQDRSGSKPLLRQLANRLYEFEVEPSSDDWCSYAIDRGDIDAHAIAFIRMRPELLNNFDPAKSANPTSRSWTQLFTEVPTDLPLHLYQHAATSKVGEAGLEWVSARDLMSKMPSRDYVRMQPDTADVPTDPAVLYALSTALSMTVRVDALDRDLIYISRIPKEFQVLYINEVLRLHPEAQETSAFITWAVKNQDILLGGN
jgi:hypothetical protein